MNQTSNPESQSTPRTRRMSEAQLLARAAQRAREEHVHVFAVAGQPGHYLTKSKSNPGERYNLVVGNDGIVGCSCKGFEYRCVCKHASALEARLAREQIRAERALRRAAQFDCCHICGRELAGFDSTGRPACARHLSAASAADLWND